MQYEHVLFDLDGTLVDTLHDVVASLNYAFSDVNPTEHVFDYDQVKLWIGAGLSPLIKGGLRFCQLNENLEDINFFSNKFLNYYEKNPVRYSKLYPYARKLLIELSGKVKSMSICSNKPEKMVVKVLKEYGLNEFFDFISGGDTFNYKKPSADHIFLTNPKINKFNLRQSLMIGDSSSDIDAANNAGIDSILVGYGYLKNMKAKNKATYFCESLCEVESIIAGVTSCS